MKKKIAILLSSILALSPISAFAASDNVLSKQPSAVLGKTIFMEEDWANGQLVNLEATDQSTDDVEYVVDGTTLYIKPTNGNIKAGDTIKLGLDNAEWFFRHNRSDGGNSTMSFANTAPQALAIKNYIKEYGLIRAANTTTPVAGENIITLNQAGINAGINSAWFALLVENYIVNAELITIDATAADVAITDAAITAAGGTTANALLGAAYTQTIPLSTTKFTSRVLIEEVAKKGGANFSNGTNEASTYDIENGTYFPNNKMYVKYNNFRGGAGVPGALPVAGTEENVAYTLTVSDDDTTATIRFYQDYPVASFANNDSGIPIPLVSLSKDEGDVRVRVGVGSNTTSISSNNIQYGLATSGNTATTVKEKITAKYNFPIERIEIREKVPYSIKQGKIYLTAPYGYYFADPKIKLNAAKEEDSRLPVLVADEDLFFRGNETRLENEVVTSNSGYKVGRYIDYAYETDTQGIINFSRPVRDKLVINTAEAPFAGLPATATGLGLQHSARTNGVLSLEGIVLVAQDYAPMDETIKINIDGDGITEEDFIIGTRKEWGVNLERISEIKKLVSGRFEDERNTTEFDKEHKTAKVKFSENVVASWWALRESEFTLTEGVKFRKVKLDKEKNLNHLNTSYILEGTYTPKAERISYIALDAKSLRITDLAIQRDKTASFEMEMWVSIEPGFEGDIELIAGGNDILRETKPVKIATAVSPITLQSQVRDVKIGYQWQKVSDFIITETATSMLKRGTEVDIFIDDDITGSDNIAIAPDFITEVNTDSKILFSKPTVSGGRIMFTIDRNSYSTPATIKFSNVYVKIDRTVPETNKRPYQIVVGGSAIAANYSPKPGIYEPLFQVKGIGTDFLNVVTSANDKDSVLSNIVRVQIGSNEVKIGREGSSEQVFMDTAAYISPESNSTMVPVRFVSQSLGIADNQIIWDNEARTVTIYNGARIIQFVVGESEITINGVTTTMYSPDMTPLKVKAEMKDNRAFLPFRALGNALGVTVDWKADIQTAIYNSEMLEDNAVLNNTNNNTVTNTTAPNTTSSNTTSSNTMSSNTTSSNTTSSNTTSSNTTSNTTIIR